MTADRWNALRVAIVNMWIASNGKPVSKKLVRSLLASAVVYGVTYAVTKLGLHLSVTETALIPQAAALLAGFGAGWLTREFPQIVTDGTAVADPVDRTPVTVPKPEPAPGDPAALLPSQRPLAYRQNAIPGTTNVRVVPTVPRPESVPDDADAGTVTMAAVKPDAPSAPPPAPSGRYSGPTEEGPRTVVG